MIVISWKLGLRTAYEPFKRRCAAGGNTFMLSIVQLCLDAAVQLIE